MGDDNTAAAAPPTEMKVDPARAAALVANLAAVKERLAAAISASPSSAALNVRLVAVSKLKPANDILALHQPTSTGQEGQLHFGENYAQELRDKAALLPRSIQWHFIGGLQSGHCKSLARVRNLWCVSSVDSAKKAKLLDTARGAFRNDAAGGDDVGPIHIHVQVNTSGEESKSGCEPGDETVALCRTIVEECPNLKLLGLMTIGAIARSKAVAVDASEENPDFVALREQRDLVTKALGLSAPLELSMGMSDDFASAVASGSGEVRIGSTIFGVRPAKADAKLTV
ncbi:YggS family pyridoxal phosphate enzyme [Sporothrix schenckii ATCC 58251]|uniref:Pyridoxal phosphate homeostasis protein n=1 Tax=Sporothrix schenckii (strain ATCC 58251 / de Perez 2211183) TaxID=1391915 RepID=U7PZI8_SPOS1|nr:YggS family pyridoxal phosphate enzyme [Sporothrix schenckii ATCC 58251]